MTHVNNKVHNCYDVNICKLMEMQRKGVVSSGDNKGPGKRRFYFPLSMTNE